MVIRARGMAHISNDRIRRDLDDKFLQAVAEDDAPRALRLLSQGANINARNNHNETALIAATHAGLGKMALLLLDAHASLDPQDRDGNTALIQAAAGGHIAIARQLIEDGADISIENKHGEKALDLALRGGRAEMVELFEKPLKKLIAQIPTADFAETVRQTQHDSNAAGDTILTWAARNGQENIVRAMIQAGADLQMKNNDGKTPLQVAVESGNHTIIRLLKAAQGLPVDG